jgi:hypothetical protein
MGTIQVKEFTGGLDTRRLPETTPGGALIRARNGHLTRGAEFEQRAAFVPVHTLPAGTTGLARGSAGLVVFGAAAAPSGVPAGVTYQRLQHPTDPALTVARVLSWDRYAGKIYAAAQFSNGEVLHFYDGAHVADWFDGRARALLTVTGGHATAALTATGAFRVGAGTPSVDTVDSVTVNGIALMAGAVTYGADAAATAAAVAAAITANTSSPDYSAAADGDVVTITAALAGAAANGRTVAVATTGVSVSGISHMAGGAEAATSTLTELRVDGVQTLAGSVAWAGTVEATAAAIAASINAATTSPEYDAAAVGPTVVVIAAVAGAAANGRAITTVAADGLTLDPASGAALADGADSTAAFTPGRFVKTIRAKVYSTAGGFLHYSGVQQPTAWTTDATGAGFEDLSVEDADADNLVGIARYFDRVAVFADDVTMIWFVDPDPTLNTLSQVLVGTGTRFAESVTQFGDADVFYAHRSGLRSLRARDSSNAAASTDIGVPVDSLIAPALAAIPAGEEHRVRGLINPLDNRFWLIIDGVIYVFSFYENAKVSAWSTYEPGFDVEGAVAFDGRVWVRSGDTIYAYGGTGASPTYDNSTVEAWLPYLDANAPSAVKQWSGVDAALRGTWKIEAAADPTDTTAAEEVGRVYKTTYSPERIPLRHASTHLSLRFTSLSPPGDGPAVLSAAALHFDGRGEEA